MTATEHSIDRSGWPAGPWDGEGDRAEWVTAVGLPGLMVRNHLGAWCGYVAVNPGHPYHGLDYGQVDDVVVHWGLTYSGACQGRICHVPEPGQPDDVWWLGFDCAHGFDVMPGMLAALNMAGVAELYEADPSEYRDVAYVRAEVEDLASQLAAKV